MLQQQDSLVCVKYRIETRAEGTSLVPDTWPALLPPTSFSFAFPNFICFPFNHLEPFFSQLSRLPIKTVTVCF